MHQSRVGLRAIAAAVGLSMAATTALIAAPAAATATPQAAADARRAGGPPRGCPGAASIPTAEDVLALERATLCLINQARAGEHVAALRPSAPLQGAASEHTEDMLAEDYFADQSLAGDGPLAEIERSLPEGHAISAGGNIGWGTGAYATPWHVFREWMGSPPHRQNILDSRFREIGVSVAPAVPSRFAGGVPGGTYTVDFASWMAQGRGQERPRSANPPSRL